MFGLSPLKLLRLITLIGFTALGLAQFCYAQSATLTGTVTDRSGAILANAQVTLSDDVRHEVRHATTDQTGIYRFESLPGGKYTLIVEANNFARYRNDAVSIGESPNATANVQLQVSSVSQSVTVRDDHESPLEVSALGKTDTKLEELPLSVQVISKEVLTQQGATLLKQSMANASGVSYGGQDSKGFYDHFLIRGLNATIYEDGFTDGDQLGGVTHSLNGVERVEVLEGPGSALFGSGAPGGTISLIHYTPSSTPYYGFSMQGGAFASIVNSDYVTGPTGIAGLSYRVDATFSHSEGYRDLSSHDYEGRPSLEWQKANHVVDFAVDARHTHDTPDSYGLIYFQGRPITGVAATSKYSTPFTSADQPFVRPTISDTWLVNPHLTISNRFSYLHRELNALGNGDSTSTKVSNGEVVGRQLRKQNDDDNSYDYQFEPVWHFNTGTVHHTLLTGLEYLRQTTQTSRTTADLPNIPDAFAPVPPETSVNGLAFQCDAKHSCDDDHLIGNYGSLYATDQVDLTARLKIRGGFRWDLLNQSLTPLITVPGRFGTDTRPLVANVTDARLDKPVSWNAGILYKIAPWIIPYFGASSSHLANFNSENTQNGVGEPESALQYEGGVKLPLFQSRIALNVAGFSVDRDHVATLVTLNGIETIVFDAQRTRGFEASFDGKVTDQWHLLANVTTQNAIVTDNPQGITSVGNHPQGAPSNIANLWTTYDFDRWGLHGFEVGAGVNFLGKTYSDITNANSIPGYTIANATASYRREAWTFRINADNFTDRRYFTAGNAAGAYVGNPASVYGQIVWTPTRLGR